MYDTKMISRVVNFLLRRDVMSFFVLLGITFGICASLASQYLFGFQPCRLCVMQRYILFFAFSIVSCALYYRSNEKLFSISLWLAMCSLFSVCCIAIYQMCIQYGVVPEPHFCVRNDLTDKSVDELIAHLQNTASGSCKDFGPVIFGLPMSLFSAVGTFSLCFYMVIALVYRKSTLR